MFAYSQLISPRLDKLLLEYGASHQNSTNMAIHWVFEPLAVVALLALVHSSPLPYAMIVMVACIIANYAYLSFPMAVVLAVFGVFFSFLAVLLVDHAPAPVWYFAVPVLVVCWVMLLIGHRIEGNYPSVFKNPQLLIMGPVWLLTQSILVKARS